MLFVILVILGIAWSFRRKRRQKKGNTYIIICKFFFKINGSQEKNSIQFGCLIYFRIQFCSQNYLEDIKWSLTCKGTSIKCLNKSRIVSFCFTSLYSLFKRKMGPAQINPMNLGSLPISFLLVSHCDCCCFAFKTLRWTALLWKEAMLLNLHDHIISLINNGYTNE